MDHRPDPRQVVAGLLDDQRFLTACAARDMGAVFRLLNSRGVSTRRLAAAADITQGRLYDYMNGRTRVEKLALFEQISAANHFSRAFALARAADDQPLAAHIAASTSHLCLHRGDPCQASHWATIGLELARQGPRLPSLTARLHTALARALAASHQFGSAVRSLDLAHTALTTRADESHPWLSPFDHATLAGDSALVFGDLGRQADALRCAEEAVALREEGRTRSLAFSRITLARAHICDGDLDAAIAVGDDLLTTSPTLGSVRVVDQLDGLVGLLGRHRGYKPVREYLARSDEASRTRLLLLADIIPSPRGGTS
ncbi:XRE family transcriptional regulator [Kitasatospora sp. NPDC056651]|uniref:XRE family transcriptional regulator n=1 Tax=Kitasatospora sp. NPDC056651 TaxID=3345892 RepID=UPI00367DAF37